MKDCKLVSSPLPVNYKLSSSMFPSNEVERMEISQWKQLADSWQILVESIEMLLRGSLDISKGPQVLLYVTEDQNYLSEVMSIQILQVMWIKENLLLAMYLQLKEGW
ncbi:hypothetical protein CR513_21987, partial [Mucuna pruriens]